MDDNTSQERESYLNHCGAGMDALMSAIEYQQRGAAQDASRYSMMSNKQDYATTGGVSSAQDEAETERLRAQLNSQQQVAAAFYQNLTPGAIAAAGGGVPGPLWGNPMLMPLVPSLLPGLRPGIQPQRNILQQGLSSTDTPESSDAVKAAELANLSLGFPGLPYFSSSGALGVPADKIVAAHEAAAKSLRYQNPGNFGQYFGIPGYPNMLSAAAPGLLPSVAQGMLNSAAMGVLGNYPSYYQNALFQRLPYMPHIGQTPMLRMPMGGRGLSTPPVQAQENPLAPGSPMRAEQRPQSSGYHLKETLQKRVSAPNPGTGSHFRMPLRNEALVRLNSGGKSNSSYSSHPHMSHLPPPDSSRSQRPRAQFDPKSIGRRISDIISENEKILCSPALEKVKPRRVFRRNSLDPPLLHPPTLSHPPLTATHSAPRSLNTKYSSPLLKERTLISEHPSFLSVPSRLTDPLPCSNELQRPYTTVIPDPRRDPSAGSLVSNVLDERRVSEPLNNPMRFRGPSELSTKEGLLCCDFCGAQFSQYAIYKAHKTIDCTKRPDAEISSARQSVIQHTALQPGETTSGTSSKVEDLEVKVTLSETQPEKVLSGALTSDAVSPRLPVCLETPARYIHKDLHRTHSADAALLPRRLEEEAAPSVDCTIFGTSSATSTPLSLWKCDSKKSPKPESLPASMSSIPTSKLPPKKKQLQLMRSNGSGESRLSSPQVSGHSPSPVTSDHSSSMAQETSAQEESASNSAPSPSRQFEPHSSLGLDASPSQKTLSSWISFEMDEKNSPSNSIISPTIYMAQPSPTHVGKSFPTTSMLSSPTKDRSPTSPKSPSRRLSSGRGSRSPSRSPTSSGLESTIPRSNYKLLLHQLSLRNQQDMGYLSEAYRHSKDKKLKRNIASLLWSSVGTHSVDASGTSSKRMRLDDGPSMEELYPGKASLARRLSPNSADSRFSRLYHDSAISPEKTPLAHSRSRPYESTLKVHAAVTRSHSAGHSSDVNNNIKQFLQNKNRNQQAAKEQLATSQHKGHKPLTRTNANARYLLKSPTNVGVSSPASTEANVVLKSALEARNSMSEIGYDNAAQRLKDSLVAKRAASHNPESSKTDYQSKRQKLVPIPKQSSAPLLPKSLVASKLADHILGKSEVKELPKIKSINPRTVQTPFLLQPHGSPSLGYEPHPTFCSLVSPQPMYVELQQSTLSMYSQWAVSEPLLPTGMTVLDIFNKTRVLKPLSPFISYNSLFTTPKQQQFLITDTKDYKPSAKKDSEPDETTKIPQSLSKSVEKQDVEMAGDTVKKQDSTDEKSWMFSRMDEPILFHTSCCYTSCHNKVSQKPFDQTSNFVTSAASESSKADRKTNFAQNSRKAPKLPPPKVVIHPPSSSDSQASDSDSDSHCQSPKNSDIVTLEFSDCDSDDDAIKKPTQRHFLTRRRAPSPPLSSPTAKNSPKPISEPASDQIAEKKEINAAKDLNTATYQDEISPICETNKDGEAKNCIPTPGIQTGPSCDAADHDGDSSAGSKGQSSDAEKDDSIPERNKRIRRSRKERNAASPRLQRRKEGISDSPPTLLEDPNLAVHPIGACSDDPTKVCALCRMKTGEHEDEEDASHREEPAGCSGKSEAFLRSAKADSETKPQSPPASHSATSSRPQTPTTPRLKTPTSARLRTPWTVSVPKRSRDKTASKSCNQPLTPGILDKARGKGTTQHWVTCTDLRTELASDQEQEVDQKSSGTKPELKSAETKQAMSSSAYFSAMPPNKNPVLEVNLPKPPESPPVVTTVAAGGLQALAAVVSGVMRSAKMQSKKKQNISKNEITEMLSHSRPLIPTSDFNGPANHDKLSEKVKNNQEAERVCEITSQDYCSGSAGSASNRTKSTVNNLSLSSRETELFLSKTNEARKGVSQDDSNLESPEDILDVHNGDDGHHSDSAKEDTLECDGESSNPRPHKCMECKTAFRIAGHLAKHLRSKGHIIAMQKKTLNRLKQQKLTSMTGQDVMPGGQGVNVSNSLHTSASSPDQIHLPQTSRQEELLTQLGEGAENLAQSQVRALLEGNDEYAEINMGGESGTEAFAEASDEEGEFPLSTQVGTSDPRPFKCIACKVAFRFQGHLDRHFRSNTHLLAVGHFERDNPLSASGPVHTSEGELPLTANNDLALSDEAFFSNSELGKGEFSAVLLPENCDATGKEHVALNHNIARSLLCSVNGQSKLPDTNVKQEIHHPDWSNSKSLLSKQPINGMVPLPRVDEPKSDSSELPNERRSPANQSKSNPVFESPPTLLEIPLPSTSPVQKMQRLTC